VQREREKSTESMHLQKGRESSRESVTRVQSSNENARSMQARRETKKIQQRTREVQRKRREKCTGESTESSVRCR